MEINNAGIQFTVCGADWPPDHGAQAAISIAMLALFLLGQGVGPGSPTPSLGGLGKWPEQH